MKRKIYITITPDETVQNSIREIVQDLSTKNPVSRKLPISWTNTAKYHINLSYLGAITDEALQAAYQAVATTAVRFSPFEVSLGQLSYLYSDKKESGSTVTLDIIDRDKTLKELFKDQKNELELAEFSPAKHFSPHIVLGILKRQRKSHEQKSMLDSLTEIELPEGQSFTVTSIDVIEATNDEVINPKHYLMQSIPLGLQS